jgi:hypothetical protein
VVLEETVLGRKKNAREEEEKKGVRKIVERRKETLK